MKIIINEIERECQVVLAPKGAFCIWNIKEGCFGFPGFVIIAPAVTSRELSCGNILTCPVVCCNDGYESASVEEIYDEINLNLFKNLVIGYYETYECDSIVAVAIEIYERFLKHGTIIDPSLEYFMNHKKYNDDEDFAKANEDRVM